VIKEESAISKISPQFTDMKREDSENTRELLKIRTSVLLLRPP